MHLMGWDQITVLARVVDEDKVRRALIEPFEPASESGGAVADSGGQLDGAAAQVRSSTSETM